MGPLTLAIAIPPAMRIWSDLLLVADVIRSVTKHCSCNAAVLEKSPLPRTTDL